MGSVGLLKGVHYLAEATRRLKAQDVKVDVVVAGPGDQKFLDSPLLSGPRYLGQVPRTYVRREFLQADVFVLPTLCDSFGLVHLEAMACGVPVITTPNGGSLVRDGVDGFIVPIRDSGALSQRIEQVTSDRKLRGYLSRNARERARQFTWLGYERRLVEAISGLVQ